MVEFHVVLVLQEYLDFIVGVDRAVRAIIVSICRLNNLVKSH